MNSIEKAQKLKSELDALRPLSKEVELRIMQKFRLDWNYHSNHLEGNSLSYGETKALILFGITAQGKPLKDHFEMTGHDEAIKWIMEVIKQERPLSENFIRELHKLLLKEPYEVEAITPEGNPTRKRIEIGQYKTIPNHVKTVTGEIFRFATPEETPALMGDLIDWYRSEIMKEDINPVIVASEFHYRFIRIHPFDDGNGRTARILMNFILMQFGYPPVIIKTDDKSNYFGVLRQADAGLIEPFIDYIASNLVSSLNLMIKGAKGESIEDPDDFDKEISLLKQKFEGLSQPIEISKSKESILDIFDKSIVPLTNIFMEKGGAFEDFYINSDFLIFSNGSASNSTKETALGDARVRINGNTRTIQPDFRYSVFKQKGFQEAYFNSSIVIEFGVTEYKVFSLEKEVLFEKLYTEQLEKEEMIELVRAEVKRHTKYIEQQITKTKKSK